MLIYDVNIHDLKKKKLYILFIMNLSLKTQIIGFMRAVLPWFDHI